MNDSESVSILELHQVESERLRSFVEDISMQIVWARHWTDIFSLVDD